MALLRLTSPAVLGDTASPACLPDQGEFGDSSSFPAGMTCVLTGWGRADPGEHIQGDLYGQVRQYLTIQNVSTSVFQINTSGK